MATRPNQAQPDQQKEEIKAPLLTEELPPRERLNAYLRYMVANNGSDIHFKANSPVFIRVNGRITPIGNASESKTPPRFIDLMMASIMNDRQRKEFRETKECDMSYSLPGVSRFRVNVFRQSGFTGAVLRTIPLKIKTIKELGLPGILEDLADIPKGLILVTGPTGSGKSTTLAAMIDHVNITRNEHILTIEDPIEFLHRDKSCSVCQREVGQDTRSFDMALRSALREDPDVILVGELRTLETISMAITTAETGHLVFATLHTTGAVPTINRIIDVFPPHQQQQVRMQLSVVLESVVSQTLVPIANGRGRVVAHEIMVINSAISSLIRENKVHMIHQAIQAGKEQGMHTLDQHLLELLNKRQITYEDALAKCAYPEELKKQAGR
ncbi:MAG TPA: type IV pilus twitching motility protein PilT [bacterium]|nr:type IV pilus twitching motility protein PilT [bacterium]